MSMKEFYTRQKANEGKKVFLSLPDGTPSEHWLLVRGVDSDEFRVAQSKSHRDAMALAQIEDEQERLEAIEVRKRDLIASLVGGWSFPEECTKENVVEFLKEAPQIADAVDRVAMGRASFFAKRSDSSTDSPKQNSVSKSSQRAPKRRSKTT